MSILHLRRFHGELHTKAMANAYNAKFYFQCQVLFVNERNPKKSFNLNVKCQETSTVTLRYF